MLIRSLQRDLKQLSIAIYVMSGLMILVMVFCHSCSNSFVYKIVIDKLFYFFMCWFFLKAGMLDNGKRTLRELTSYLSRKLMVPYCVFTFLAYLAVLFQTWLEYDYFQPFEHLKTAAYNIIVYGSILGNRALWFLLAFFIVKLLIKYFSQVGISSLLVCAVSMIGAFACYHWEITTPLYLGNILLGLCFYAMGEALKNHIYNYLFVGVCFVLYLCSLFTDINFGFHENEVIIAV